MIVDVNALRGPLLRELAIGPKANTAGKKKKYGPVMHFWSAAEGKRWRPWGTTARNRSFKGILRPPSMAARARHGPREANSSGLGRSPSAPLKALYRSLPANISIHRIDRPFIWPSSGRFLGFSFGSFRVLHLRNETVDCPISQRRGTPLLVMTSSRFLLALAANHLLVHVTSMNRNDIIF